MKKYHIIVKTEEEFHAGSKAPADIATIAEKLGFERIEITIRTMQSGLMGTCKRQERFYQDWNRCYDRVEDNSIILLQHPFHHFQMTRYFVLKKLKEKKKVKIISLINDVEELREYRDSMYYHWEFNEMMALADVFIVHNSKMKEWFEQKGVDERKIVTLEIFDYLQPEKTREIVFSKTINVAGNLNTQKSGYIYRLSELSDINVNLYGVEYDERMNQYSNVIYRGAFPADEIPDQLTTGYGLVWDGDSIDSCTGGAGRYLLYNNPHKLSLYLSLGMPVIIWKKAAEAEFVEKHHVGYCVNSLLELPGLLGDEAEFLIMQKNASQIGNKLRDGAYVEAAIQQCMEKLQI